MTRDELQSTVSGAHPAAGMIAVAVIPESREGETPDATLGPIRFVGTGNPGVEAAIILEVGDMSHHVDEGWEPGDKIFYQVGCGITIGDRHFVTHQSVLAYQKAGEF